MPKDSNDRSLLTDAAEAVIKEIRSFASESPANRMPTDDKDIIFDEPLVQFADGDDAIFTEYKTIINPEHMTPREALAQAYDKKTDDMPSRLSVISWILPISSKARKSNYRRTRTPSRIWAYTRQYGENFNNILREHMVNFLTGTGYMATAPMIMPFFKILSGDRGLYSNWSERHIAYATGLGTFSLSDGFITEKGIAHRCGSVVTSLELPASPRTVAGPYSNCLSYVNETCGKCVDRCPAGAISESGHDKNKCLEYARSKLRRLSEKYNAERVGCGLCQTKVPCEAGNPTRKLKD